MVAGSKNTAFTGCTRAVVGVYRGCVPSSIPFVVVFSDIDDVFADAHTAYDTAASVLAQLGQDEAALVLCSSRTRAQLDLIQQRLSIRHPFICEYGRAVGVPVSYFDFEIPHLHSRGSCEAIEFGRPYADVVDVLHRTAERLDIRVVGFSDMSIGDVARELHVPLLEARLAKLREYVEPFRVLNPNPGDRERLFKALRGVRLQCTIGDRFDYVGSPIDLSAGVNLLNNLYKAAHGTILRAAFSHVPREQGALQRVDRYFVQSPQEGGAAPIGVADWADAIVGAVRQLQRRRWPASHFG
jgi:predicted mannosyl-3-phosphoglycerate phosphatase (HAD superfamily)